MTKEPKMPGGCPAIRRVMMPRDTNAVGTIFGGVILSEIDLAAAIEANRHHSGRMVTVAMDAIVFREPVWSERNLTNGQTVPPTPKSLHDC